MSHWSLKYLGQSWTEKQDCFYWFRRIQEEVFGRRIEDLQREKVNLVLFASRLMERNVGRYYQWVRTPCPVEGDAAFLSQATKPHHIGVVTMIRNKIRIVHAPDFGGVLLSDAVALRINNWKIVNYWTPKNEDQ